MGAILTDDVPILEILKPTGYNCPEELMGKTWGDVSKSGGATKLYAWSSYSLCYTLSATPAIGDKVYMGDESGTIDDGIKVIDIGDEYATITIPSGTFSRNTNRDLTL